MKNIKWGIWIMVVLGKIAADAYLEGCSVSATNPIVGSSTSLVISAVYRLGAASDSITFYLSNSNIQNYFPSTISSNLGTANLNTNLQRLEISGVTISGAVNAQVTVQMNVTVFQNPSNCSQEIFACKDSKGNYEINAPYTATAATLGKLTVDSDSSSTVSGYSPVTISISPSTSFPLGGIISISELTLSNYGTDCSGYVTQKDMLNSITCNYASSTVKITAASFTDSSTALSSSSTITLKISNAQYNYKMSGRDLTVKLYTSDSYLIESGTNATALKPVSAASFKTLSFSYQSSASTFVGNSSSFFLQICPSIEIQTSQKVKIEILSGPIATSTPICSQLSGTQSPGTVVQGYPTVSFGTSYNTMIFLSTFVLPNTEIPFKVRVTTYYSTTESDDEIVHQQNSSTLNATRVTLPETGKISFISGAIVSEKTTHSFIVKVPCPLSSAATFQISLPSVYDATAACNSNINCALTSSVVFTLSNVLATTLSGNSDLNISFEIANPPSTKPMTDSFNIIGKDSGYASFELNTTLESGLTYASGTLSSLAASAESYGTYEATKYTITFTTNHKVPSGSTMTFTFPTEIITTRATLHSVKIGGSVTSGSQHAAGVLTITNSFLSDITTVKPRVIISFNNIIIF